jgi:hypothetical protein
MLCLAARAALGASLPIVLWPAFGNDVGVLHVVLTVLFFAFLFAVKHEFDTRARTRRE